MNENIDFGKKGEDITTRLLKKNGFIIFKRNYKSKFGEIDIIAEKGNLLAFVEVKTRFEGSYSSPKEAVNIEKQRRIKLTAKEFISKTYYDYRFRFDVSEITVSIKDGEYKYTANYIKNAFE